ncbi:A disintegrin and metalloproteinase with thrombospondin motifs 17 [Orchesella cincta]|uniref:A disintegrin and metalloproteinase with thrombospondin motifs 17 n=1 Tax=Orchesella cincta TaxID=48709 RepID=A0A1D2NMY1_ORCCI|nr:A disintegrin and metalloproteinase with thrombospondin motifs 17 [Orchesella cincta]
MRAREINLQDKVKLSSPIEMKVDSESGRQYDLKLTKAGASVLHPNIQVISIGVDKQSGHPLYDSWSPSNEELKFAEEVYVDEKNLATVRVNYENDKRSIVGVVDGMRLEDYTGNPKLYTSAEKSRSDYIDIGRTLTWNEERQEEAVNAVVEVVIICDKEFGDAFQHDRVKILDYLTVYFWDINLRFKTLPSSNISFRVTGVVIISVLVLFLHSMRFDCNNWHQELYYLQTPSAQPFIEEARGPDGKADYGRILGGFSYWVYDQMSLIPKFDMAISITNTEMEWYGGMAYLKTACNVNHGQKRHLGTLVFSDAGNWSTVAIGTHEIAHNLGAPHDDDANYPGGCTDRGYIMGGISPDLQWFFSTCSDRTIGSYIRSDQAACLRTIDHGGNLPISPDFSFILAPSKEEQCKRRLNNENAFIKDEAMSDCKNVKCWVPQDYGWSVHSLAPLDNTPCGDGRRCFRGRCRDFGSLIRNVGNNLCLRATNPFAFRSPVDLVDCPRPGTPLDRFAITDWNIGKVLSTPWSTPDAKENNEKCIFTGNAEGDIVTTDRCTFIEPTHGWVFIDVGNSEFLISHRSSKKCIKPVETEVRSYVNCDRNDASMRWTLA